MCSSTLKLLILLLLLLQLMITRNHSRSANSHHCCAKFHTSTQPVSILNFVRNLNIFKILIHLIWGKGSLSSLLEWTRSQHLMLGITSQNWADLYIELIALSLINLSQMFSNFLDSVWYRVKHSKLCLHWRHSWIFHFWRPFKGEKIQLFCIIVLQYSLVIHLLLQLTVTLSAQISDLGPCICAAALMHEVLHIKGTIVRWNYWGLNSQKLWAVIT